MECSRHGRGHSGCDHCEQEEPQIDAEDGGGNCCRIIAECEAFLAANRAMVDALLARITSSGAERGGDVLAPAFAMETLKLAQLIG
ncbi:hypothetical protein [Pseudorhodoplanes sp.]|uniref:hypothetical protein n=1 Tax=Pseudorhodoplanes sp. TaxID=1934341 RepID=UPI002C5FF155|nr:hypothetical protein [Pseudorhodoplanes sp.]HWV55029.1 hypothetical protein [Pseudorhodoplanes sp.]